MGKSLNSATRYESPVVTDEQIRELSHAARSGKNFTTETIANINGLNLNIRDQIEKAWKQGIFVEQDKDVLLHRLQSISSVDRTGLEAFEREIQALREEMLKLKARYKDLLYKNRELFAYDEDSGYDAARLYEEDFDALTIQGRRERDAALAGDLIHRANLKQKMINLGIPLEKIRKMRRSTMENMLRTSTKSLEDCNKILSLPGLFSQVERNDYMEQMRESTGPEQAQLLQKLYREASERKGLQKIYQTVAQQYGQFCLPPNEFNALSLQERKDALEAIGDRLTKAYAEQQQNHAYSKHIAEDSQRAALSYVKGLPLVGVEEEFSKVKALQALNHQFDAARKQNEENFDWPLAELMELKNTSEDKAALLARKDGFYSAPYAVREKMIDQLKEDLLEARENSEVAKKLTKDYFSKVDNAFKDHIISEKKLRHCKETWANRPFKEKIFLVAKFDEIIEDRIHVLEDFNKALQELQSLGAITASEATKRQTEFYVQDLLQRTLTVESLKKQLKEVKTAQKDGKKVSVGNHIEEDVAPMEMMEESERDRNIMVFTQQADAAERALDWAQAAVYYEAILKLDPEHRIARRGLWFVQQKMGYDADMVTTQESDETVLDEDLKLDKDALEEVVLLEGVGNLGHLAEQKETGVWEATERETHLATDFDVEVARKVAAVDDGVILTSDGHAEMVKTMGVKDLGLNATWQERNEHRAYLRGLSHLDSKGKREAAAAVQIEDDQGKAITAKKALEAAEVGKQALVEGILSSQGVPANNVLRKKAEEAVEKQLEAVQETITKAA